MAALPKPLSRGHRQGLTAGNSTRLRSPKWDHLGCPRCRADGQSSGPVRETGARLDVLAWV